MRPHLFVTTLLIAASWTFSSSVHAQSTARLPGCEPAPEVRKVLDERLDSRKIEKMKFADETALIHRVLEELIAKYPREYEPYRRLIESTRMSQPDDFPALQERFTKLAKENPNDPL